MLDITGFLCPKCAHRLIPGSVIGVRSLRGKPLTPCTLERAQEEASAGRAIWLSDQEIQLIEKLVKRKDYRALVFERDGNECVWCGQPADSLDHIIPQYDLGRYHPTNLMPACQRCNSERQHRSVEEYIAWLEERYLEPFKLDLILERTRIAKVTK